MDYSGLLPINKPLGMTSKDVSRVILRKYGKLKIGHVGTLDPDADGVLTVLLGEATKFQDYLLEMRKTYEFSVKFGESTTTMDRTGDVVDRKSWSHLNADLIESHLNQFLGKINQIPPIYSAVKYQGRELYKYARQNEATEAEVLVPLNQLSREVEIYSLKLISYQSGIGNFEVNCSKGTYVRTLASDLALKLETVGHVCKLRRTRSAGFSLNQCFELDSMASSTEPINSFTVKINDIHIGLPIMKTDDKVLLRRIKDGQRINVPSQEFYSMLAHPKHDLVAPNQFVLIEDVQGNRMGIAEYRELNQEITLHLKRGLTWLPA
ncbi:MAG: tRNA pseudouridine(55) synthase TruB [Proteobacteria bacterium]|nr:tRNA pseudouridine(55) synthase TruB [Pseudomonadota bacterium]